MGCKNYENENIKICSYVVRYDSGFAPNPFWGYCTLACCKSPIRKSKNVNVGDWIIGTGSTENVGNDKLIYTMKITEKMSFENYSEDKRFKNKIPRSGLVEERGDNIYYKKSEKWKQRPSYHGKKNMEDDLSGKCVLISDYYYYYGREAIPIPKKFNEIIKRFSGWKGIPNKTPSDKRIVEKFLKWIKRKDKGIHGIPWDFEPRSSSIKKRKC